ncbi:uncharacterized protein PODANS_1_18485 [Podospora anserina S mat+]|uniref:Podospora anserina S mat+ genomic DNA chromosome 1, supercontig 4 n=1 Tax=Podospora anserina (strain S / ATCC MYA-4624 / DSM 980 / FGSC 10383) TaxID=515849 RepID=B2AUA6_PODAN|nr:uncharacterized protein PODANS_1_18485 [Podospora anserina S mat+]CAP67979.1 unnamed protein product [Podospora anserina S mat+]CDP24238.1 Putative protein of unknown function [Podospora anserina S mat+]
MDTMERKHFRLGTFLAPPSTIDVDPADFALRTKLELIGKDTLCDIKAINVDDTTTQISIHSPGTKAAQDAAQRVRKLLIEEADIKDMWRTNGLLCPSKSGADYSAIVFGRDRCAVVPSASAPTVSETTSGTHQAKYKAQLSDILDRAVGSLVRDPNKMQMRVKIGYLQRREIWNPEKRRYSSAEMERELEYAAFRDVINLSPYVPVDVVEALRVALINGDESLPAVVRESVDPDSEPEFSLYIVTPNLEIECMVEGVEAGRGRKPRIMPVCAYQRAKFYNKFSVLNACPDRGTDWELKIFQEVSRREGRPRLPLTEDDMARLTKISQGTYAGGFPKISVSQEFIKKNKVSNIVGKVIWTLELSFKYSLEITVYHSFGTNTTKPPITTTLLSVFSPDWDDHLGLPVTIPREWDKSFATQLLTSRDKTQVPYPLTQDGGDEHPLDEFLSWVSWVQEMLDNLLSVGAKGSNRVVS